MASQAYDVIFIHNQLGDFVKQTLQWICDDIMIEPPQYKFVATYDKAVMRFNQKLQEYQDVPLLPSISINPTNLNYPDDRKTLLYQHSRLAHTPILPRLYDPIAKTDDWALYPMYQRLSGSLEVTLWLPSVYSVLDHHLRVLDFFGGTGRIVRPKILESCIILPSTMEAIVYINEYEQTEYVIDLISANPTDIGINLLPTVDKKFVVVNQQLSPYYKLSDVSENNEQYGGDDIADWKLTFTLEWQCDFPIWLFLVMDGVKVELINLGMISGYLYSWNNIDIPRTITTDKDKIYTLSERTTILIDKDYESCYIIDNVDPDESKYLYLVLGPSGILKYDIIPDKDQLRVYGSFKQNDMLLLVKYINE